MLTQMMSDPEQEDVQVLLTGYEESILGIILDYGNGKLTPIFAKKDITKVKQANFSSPEAIPEAKRVSNPGLVENGPGIVTPSGGSKANITPVRSSNVKEQTTSNPRQRNDGQPDLSVQCFEKNRSVEREKSP